MKIEKKPRIGIDSRINSFGQIVKSYENFEDVTVTGTLEEILEYSMEHPIYIRRSTNVESFFPAWDTDGKYVVIANRSVLYIADYESQIDGKGWYIHEAVVA